MFSGSFVALVTPMELSGNIDYSGLKHLLAWHLSQETDGFVVLGTTGEAATIEPEERIRLIEEVVAFVNGRVPVIVGTGDNSTSRAIEKTQQALQLGADGALIVTPYYNRPTQEGLFQHFSALAQAVCLPQIIYNVPSRTGCDLLPQTMLRLSKFPNVVGLKDGTGDLDRVSVLTKEEGLDLFSGDDKTAKAFIFAGGKGVISVVANVHPKLMHDLVKAAALGDLTAASQCEDSLLYLYDALGLESNPIPVKWMLQQMGRIGSGIRLPLTTLARECHDTVRQAMHRAGLLVGGGGNAK